MKPAKCVRASKFTSSRGGDMKSPVVKRSIVIAGHKTSVSLEDAFWEGLKEIASGRDLSLSEMVAAIDSERSHGNLSSAIRLFVLDQYRSVTGPADGRAHKLETGRHSDSLRVIGADAA